VNLRRLRLPSAWPLCAAGLVAAVLRLLLLWHSGGWHSAIEYDDGVHYGSSALLTHGVVPYRDYDFLQPPGITWLLMPSAVLGRLFGDATGLVLARLATVGAAAATTVLLGRLVGRSTTARRGLLAAGIYAAAAPALVAGRTAMLEPWLDLLLVIAYGRLTVRRPSSRDAWIGGAALGLGITVKAWGLVAALVLIGWMSLQHRRTGLAPVGRSAAAAAIAATATCLPFLVLAPGRMVNDVITAQLTRPADGTSTMFIRWTQFLAIRPIFAQPYVPAALAALALAWCAVTALRRSALGWLMVAQLLAGLVMFALSGPYFFHYGDYLIGPFAVLVAVALPALRPQRGPVRRLRAAAAWTAVWVLALGGVVQLSDAWSQGQPASVNVARLTALVRGSRCVSADQPVLIELADAVGQSCHPWPDPRGTALANLPSRVAPHFYPYGFRRLAWWQQRWQRELAASSTVILTGAPCLRPDWTAWLCHQFTRDFRYAGAAGRASPGLLPVQVWRRHVAVQAHRRFRACRQQECCPLPRSTHPLTRPATPGRTLSVSRRSVSGSQC
jgi:alpha-1,2-mannosyltransferase